MNEVPLKSFAANEPNSFVDGPFGSDLKVSDYSESGVRILQLQNVGDGYFIDDNVKFTTERKALELNRCIVRPGDLLIAKMADPLARACVVPAEFERGLIVADLMKLRLGPQHDSTYVCSAINSPAFRREAERLSTGTTRTRISLSTLKRICLPERTPKEEERIGSIARTIDDAIEQTEALIAKQQQVKVGLMYDLFSRGLTPAGQLRPRRADAPDLYHETPLGWLPKEWTPTPFAKCAASFFLGTTLRGVGPGTETVPLLKMGNLTWGELDISEVEPLAMIKVADERHWLQSGDFLFNTRNTPELVGKTAVYRGEFERCTYDNNLLRVRFKGGLDSRFVCYYMSHGRGQQRVFTLATGTTSVAAIYWSALARYDLPVPLRPQESLDIADRVDTARAALAAETAHLAKLSQLKQGLMQVLLTTPS